MNIVELEKLRLKARNSVIIGIVVSIIIGIVSICIIAIIGIITFLIINNQNKNNLKNQE